MIDNCEWFQFYVHFLKFIIKWSGWFYVVVRIFYELLKKLLNIKLIDYHDCLKSTKFDFRKI